MSLFDLAAGLVIAVSALVGWFRGGVREVATVLAFVGAAIVGVAALRFTGPIARHAIHTVWIANIVAILVVFIAAYILLRVAAGALTRGVSNTKSLSALDRSVGAGFGLVRALVFLGLANLTINAVTPPERMPTWISQAKLYPVSEASAHALRAFAPEGARLARQVAPVVGHAIGDKGDDKADAGKAQNRDYDDRQDKSLQVRVEKPR